MLHENIPALQKYYDFSTCVVFNNSHSKNLDKSHSQILDGSKLCLDKVKAAASIEILIKSIQ